MSSFAPELPNDPNATSTRQSGARVCREAAAEPDSTTWKPEKVAIIGVGLLGGSFGLAIRDIYPAAHRVGVARGEASRQAALRIEAVDEASADFRRACRDADLVVIATPVDRIATLVIEAAGICRDSALVTDLGSTKAGIAVAVATNPLALGKYVGAHPIAGGEKTGAEHARHDLFRDRPVVLTPTAASDPQRLLHSATMWRALGARVFEMSPEAHDRALAFMSHLPHLVASTLAQLLDDTTRPLVGPGWLDTTRVASGDPEMWTAICKENRAEIVIGLDRMGDSLRQLRDAIHRGDDGRVFELLAAAKRSRDDVLESLLPASPTALRTDASTPP